MARPWAWRSPDARLRDIQYAREQEEQRAARIRENETNRFNTIRENFQREQQRSRGLQEQATQRVSSVQEKMRFEQARKSEIGRRRAVPTPTPPVRERAPLPLIQPGYTEAGVRERLAEGRRPGPDPIGWGLKKGLAAVQYVEEPVAAAALGAVSRAGPLGGPALGPSQQIGETPMERAPIGEELVNPVAAWFGDEEEQRKAREVLDEAGLPAELVAYLFTSPLNLIPGAGLTKIDDLARAIKAIPRLTGTARTAAIQSPRLQAAIRGIREAGEAGGPRLPKPRPGERLSVRQPATEPLWGVGRGPEQPKLPGFEDPHVARADPSPPRRPPPTRPRGPSPDDPEFRNIQEVALKGEQPSQTLIRRHDGAVNTARQLARIEVDEGNALLRQAGIGQSYKGTVVPRAGQADEFDELYRLLHNSSKVESGELVVPERMKSAYNKARELTDFEQTARLDFDPDMALVEDYFYRGWKPPEGMLTGTGVRGALGRKPGFKMPRVNATYDEMRAAGFEPLFWNPFEQARFSRMMGVKYREQMNLVEDIKALELALPHEGGPIPNGWRVPRVGPAFEGKPFALGDEVKFTRRWAVPDSLANRLENAYGVTPTLGTAEAFGKTVDLMKVVDALVFIPKRAKLVASVFQHADFLTRSGVGAWTGFVDALSHGRPIAAVGHLAKWPKSAIDIVWATVSPGYRQNLRRMAVDTTPLFKERPGLSMRSISEAGLSQRDVTILPDIDKIAREAAAEAMAVRGAKAPIRLAAEFERVHRQGLFQGVYPAAILTDVKNNIAPMFARGNPVRKGMTDAQLAGEIAKFANTKYSVIPASTSVIQNRAARGFLTRVFFSMGEQEGLLRLFTGALWGPNTSYYRKNWLGAYLGLIAVANTIHFATTGEPLPWARWSPISKDKWGPLPFGYNRDFAAPTIPLKGRSGTEVTLDLVGQLDTALRLLDPVSYLSARESVPVRAGLNQITGKDFFGAPIDTVGPGGVVSRTSQLISDMLAPIGLGQASLEAARSNIEGAEGIIQPGEDRLGTTGMIQATGINLRAETTPQLLDRIRADVMREMGIEGTYEEIKAVDTPRANEIDDRVEARIGPELEMRRETAELRGQITPEGQFFEQTEVTREQQQTAQLEADQSLNSGQWEGDVWRDDYRDRQRDFFSRREQIKQDFQIEFEDKEAPSRSVNAAIGTYFDVNVDDHLQSDGTIDWDSFFKARDRALSPLSGTDKARVMAFVRKYDTPTVKEFRKAQDIVDEFYDKPKYEGLSVEEGERLDDFVNVTVEEFQRRRLRETGSTFRTRIAIIVAAEESGLPEKLLNVALLLQRERFRKHIVNPERDEWLIRHERTLSKFYPDLLERELSRAQEAELGEEAFEAIAAR